MPETTITDATAQPGGDDLDALFADLPPLISVRQAAGLVGLTVPTAYRYAQNGDLPVKRIGKRRVLVVTAKLRRWLDADDQTNHDGTNASDWRADR